MTWSKYKDSIRWRVLCDGSIEVEGQGAIRTRGEPQSARIFLAEHGDAARAAAERFDIPVSWIFGMACVEAVRIRGTLSLNPRSIREEPGYISDTATPNKVSPGMMQTLLSTAEAMRRKYDLPVVVSRRKLFVAETSILLGAAYMRDRADFYAKGVLGAPFDFVFCVAAYNAGKVYHNPDDHYPFKMRTFSPTRTERAIRFHNDMVAVLKERP